MKAIVYDVRPGGWLACRLLRGLWPGCLTSPLAGLRLADLDAPSLPGDDWVRVRTLLGGICGTDLAILAQKQAPDSILQCFSSMPLGLGHENVAVVEEVGPAVDRSWIGRRVCVEPTLCCRVRGIDPPCAPCAAGQFGACENFGAAGAGAAALPAGTSIGYNNRTGGAWGECFVAHESQLVAVPEDVSDEQAVLVDPVACSLHGVLRVDLSRVGRVAVVGLGVLGLATVASLRAAGFDGQIDGLDAAETLGARAVRMGADGFVPLPPDRRGQYEAVARRVGATVHRARFGNLMLSGGYDAVFDCAGSAGALEACLKWAAARGQVALVGTAGRVTADLTPVWFRELELVGVYGRAVERIGEREIPTYQLVLDWMAGGRLDVRDLLTHTYALGEYRRALDVAMHKARHNALKVALDMRAESSAGAPVGTR